MSDAPAMPPAFLALATIPAPLPPAVVPAPPAAPEPVAAPPVDITPGRFMARTAFAGFRKHAVLSNPPSALVDIYGRNLTRLADAHWTEEHHAMVDAVNPLKPAAQGG